MVELSENIAADQRVVHMSVAGKTRRRSTTSTPQSRPVESPGALSDQYRHDLTAGVPFVSDPLRAAAAALSARRAAAARRIVLPGEPVSARRARRSRDRGGARRRGVLDLYAGRRAVLGRARGDRAADDHRGRGRSVERRGPARERAPHAPRLALRIQQRRGLPAPAPQAAAGDDHGRSAANRHVERGDGSHRPARRRAVVYVSCDPPRWRAMRAGCSTRIRLALAARFDLFPNTPHVEASIEPRAVGLCAPPNRSNGGASGS